MGTHDIIVPANIVVVGTIFSTALPSYFRISLADLGDIMHD